MVCGEDCFWFFLKLDCSREPRSCRFHGNPACLLNDFWEDNRSISLFTKIKENWIIDTCTTKKERSFQSYIHITTLTNINSGCQNLPLYQRGMPLRFKVHVVSNSALVTNLLLYQVTLSIKVPLRVFSWSCYWQLWVQLCDHWLPLIIGNSYHITAYIFR